MVTRKGLDVSFIGTLRLFLNLYVGRPSFILILKRKALKTVLFPPQGRRNLIQRLFQKELASINGSLTTQRAGATKCIVLNNGKGKGKAAPLHAGVAQRVPGSEGSQISRRHTKVVRLSALRTGRI